ncbi:MAG: glycoside hydrolase family 3 N-terminal domain-containing protein [Arachnia propionica]|uniref:glycoside hydrolase family 3 N-terminal domain-containing protein n=1 Tax=Arachnia propionica TaxID=1750 RepID=UPI00270A28A0|nr:glycoside hydrolase family 3 N-terminal domain-containing protein [Arachnia propionica]
MSQLSRRALLGTGAGAVAAAAITRPSRANAHVEPYEQLLNSLSLDQKIRQLFLQPVHGRSAGASDSRNTKLYGEATPAGVLRRHRFGGVVLRPEAGQFTSTRAVLDHTNELQRAAQAQGGVPLQVVWEGHLSGLADAGIPVTQFPEPMTLGAHEGLRFQGWGLNDTQPKEALNLGINTWFGVRADVSSTPDNPVLGTQVYGGTPEIVTARVRVDEGGARRGATQLVAVRMFPGAGDVTVGDDGLPSSERTREEWDTLEGAVFKTLATEVEIIQVGHIVAVGLDPSGTPASLSRTIIGDILRGQLRFNGVVVTDSLADPALRALHGDGELAVRALEAGADQLHDSADPIAAIEAIHAAIRDGRLSADDIHARAKRILRAKRYLPEADFLPDSWGLGGINSDDSRRIAEEAARGGVTVVHNDGVLPLGQAGAVVVGHHESLGKELTAQLGGDSDFVPVGVDPSAQEIDAAVKAAGRAGVTVVLTDGVTAHPAQKQLVEALVGAGRKVVAVAVGLPQDVGLLDAAAKVATYTSRPLVARGLAEVLTGAFSPKGRLPVAVPTADGGELPIGTGLTW